MGMHACLQSAGHETLLSPCSQTKLPHEVHEPLNFTETPAALAWHSLPYVLSSLPQTGSYALGHAAPQSLGHDVTVSPASHTALPQDVWHVAVEQYELHQLPPAPEHED